MAAPLIPHDMKWVVSYETPMFDTANGDLGMDEYAVKGPGEWWIRTVPQSEGNFEATTTRRATRNKTLVNITAEKSEANPECVGCAYYSEFQGRKGNIVRVNMNRLDYKDLGRVKNKIQPKRTEMLNSIDSVTAEAAIAHDGSSNAISSGSSVSWSHTVTSADTGAAVVFGCHSGADTIGISATFNGTSMTGNTEYWADASAREHECEGLVLATAGEGTGSKTVQVSFTSSVSNTGMALTYTGVDQTTPYDGYNGNADDSANGGSDSVTITSETDDLVVGFLNIEDGEATPNFTLGGGQTEREKCDDSTTPLCPWAADFGYIASDEAGGASVTHSYSTTDSGPAHVIIGLNLNISSGPVSSTTVTTALATDIASTSVTMNGNVSTTTGTSTLGFSYGIGGFTATNTYAVATTTLSTGPYSVSQSGLTAFKEYWYRAWASSTDGVNYGSTTRFFSAEISTSTPESDGANTASWDDSDFDDGTHATTTGTTVLQLQDTS